MNALHWSGDDPQWIGRRKNRIIAVILRGSDGYSVYDQRDSETPGPGALKGLDDTLEKAQERTAGW